jgi:GT2 family glycosyltransferase
MRVANKDELPGVRQSSYRAAREERLADMFHWRRLPGGLRYLHRQGFTALLERLFPQLRKLRTYRAWVRRYDTINEKDRDAITAAVRRFTNPPLISVLMPVYQTRERYLRAAIESVCRQLYPHWELCIGGAASLPRIRSVVEEYRTTDARVKVCYRSCNGDTSGASNSALALAAGQFVAMLDQDDMLPEHALYMVAAALSAQPELDLIFSDEDKIGPNGNRFDPCFKPDWNPDLMLSQNMFSNLGVYRRSLLSEIGGFRPGYESSRDYDLVLRASARTIPARIRHIPHILYHRRSVAGFTAPGHDAKPHTLASDRRAIASYLAEAGVVADMLVDPHPVCNRVRYGLPQPQPMVSLIIPTGGNTELLRHCLSGILHATDYEPIEVIIVYNNDTKREVFPYLNEISSDPRVSIVASRSGFNFSRSCNLGVFRAKGDIIGLINDDIEVIHADWLREMVSHAIRREIGAVGAKLYYSNNTIQHAGIIVGLGDAAGHAFRYFGRAEPGYCNRLLATQNLSAVTAACMVLRRQVFEEIGGFDAVNLPVAFNDLDLCLRIRQKGYRIVWTPYAELYHWESLTRATDRSPEEIARFKGETRYLAERWSAVLAHDPYYNPNLTLQREDFSLAFPPRVVLPWRAAR